MNSVKFLRIPFLQHTPGLLRLQQVLLSNQIAVFTDEVEIFMLRDTQLRKKLKTNEILGLGGIGVK